MALRRALGWSDGELMRSDAKPCSRLMRQTADIFYSWWSYGLLDLVWSTLWSVFVLVEIIFSYFVEIVPFLLVADLIH